MLSLLLGRGIRFLLGCGLFVLLGVWLDAKGVVTFRQVRAQAIEIGRAVDKAVHSADLKDLLAMHWDLSLDWDRLAEPVEFPGLGDVIGKALPAANLGAAALILMLSLFSGRKITGFLASGSGVLFVRLALGRGDSGPGGASRRECSGPLPGRSLADYRLRLAATRGRVIGRSTGRRLALSKP